MKKILLIAILLPTLGVTSREEKKPLPIPLSYDRPTQEQIEQLLKNEISVRNSKLILSIEEIKNK